MTPNLAKLIERLEILKCEKNKNCHINLAIQVIQKQAEALENVNCDGMCSIRGYGDLECPNCYRRRIAQEEIEKLCEPIN